MRTYAKQQLQTLVAQLISEGQELINAIPGKRQSDGRVKASLLAHADTCRFSKWQAGCRNLVHILGTHADPWRSAFEVRLYVLSEALRILGTLQAIRDAITQNLLVTVEDLIMAEAFSSLLEQAEYLLDSGYFLPAGVLGRAVLEEHLRKWCDHAGCTPQKNKPTLNDYKDALYKANTLNKLEMKHVEQMTAIGNDAAHNSPTLRREDVEHLLRDLRDFLTRKPLT